MIMIIFSVSYKMLEMCMNNDRLDAITHKAELVKAIGNPVRLCILGKLCRDGELNVSGITECIGASQSVISQHISKLRALGIVKLRKNGANSYYSISDEMVREIVEIVINWG